MKKIKRGKTVFVKNRDFNQMQILKLYRLKKHLEYGHRLDKLIERHSWLTAKILPEQVSSLLQNHVHKLLFTDKMWYRLILTKLQTIMTSIASYTVVYQSRQQVEALFIQK